MAEVRDDNNQIQHIKTDRNDHSQKLLSVVDDLIYGQNINPSEIAVLSTSWFSGYNASKVLRQNHRVVGFGAVPHRSVNNSTFHVLKSLSKYYIQPNMPNLRCVKRNVEIHLLEQDISVVEKKLHMMINDLIHKFLLIPTELFITQGLEHINAIFDNSFLVSHSTFEEIKNSISDEDKNSWTIENYIKALAGVEGITSTTIHQAKGLEFEAVILNEMNENKIPFQRCLDRRQWIYEPLTSENIEVGRKLFYVAVSRAKKHLIILHNSYPSMFVDLIK